MGLFPLFIIIVVIAAVSLIVATLAGMVCVVWFGRKKSWLFRGALLVVCCLPIVICAWQVGLFGPFSLTPAAVDPESLRSAYKIEFGEDAPADVTLIQCKQVIAGDFATTWLTFHAAPETVDRLVKKFAPIETSSFSTLSSEESRPPWWKPETANLAQFYKAEHWSPQLRVSEAFMGHDREKRVVYFYHAGSY